ncbi:unnamed protein product [Trichobilharzia szidati]|nr:unnamed protein product [Trichobilharzia szidati]
MSSKIVQDAVHGVIELEPLAVQIMDSPEFQRLREIKQLGIASFVFPSSQHSRFEHSIGTYHMAKKLLESINSDQNYSGPTLNFEEQLAVRIAALCHDLGHGPFSHMWEDFVKKGGPEYSEYKNPLKQKAFIYEILSNSLNGMDVDKWDYLLRDCLYAGLGTSGANVDVDRFLRFYRPFMHTDRDKCNDGESNSWHLSFKDTELENLLRTFSLRQHLHQKVYQHKTVTAISAMIIDALELIDPVLNLRSITMKALKCENPNDLDEFLKLHDSLLWDIYYGRGLLSQITTESFQPRIQQAQKLIHRILNRDLYTYIDSIYDMSYYAPNDADKSHQSSNSEKLSDQVNEAAIQSLALRSMGLGLGPRKSLCYEPIPPHYRTFGVTSNNTDKYTKESICTEIFKRLPPDSTIQDINDLLVTESRFTSNSTSESPKFYFYTRSGSTFTYSEPLRIIHAYRLYWRRNNSYPTNKDKSFESSTYRSVAYLNEAFNQWHQEIIKDSHA